MNTQQEIETLKNEIKELDSTFLPKGDVVEEQKRLIETQEANLKEIEKLQELTDKELKRIQDNIEPSSEENLFYTENVVEWLEVVKQIDIFSKNTEGSGPNPDRVPDLWLTECFDFNFDYETVKEASGYITAPVFKYKTKAEVASNKTFKTMQDLREYLKDKKYLLYMIIVSVKTKGCNSASFVPYRLDNPELRYTFRGHILE